MKKSAWLLIMAGGFFAAGNLLCGCQFFQVDRHKQDPVVLLDQHVYELQAELETVRQNSRDREEDLRNDYASLKAEFAEIRSEMQSLRGNVEEVSYRLDSQREAFDRNRDKQDERLTTLGENLTNRLVRLEEYLGLEKPTESNEPGNDAAAVEEDSVLVSADALYKTARQLFNISDYEAARRFFQKLLKNYPQSDMCDNAQFWIGESYYRQQSYEKAILEYQKVLDTYPDGNKVPAALLKQGLAFSHINQETNAKLVLKKLIKTYPGSNEADIAEKNLKEM
ncbi:MAG: tol-pal system protein YbgF [Desulfosudaceae bacterium]